MTIKELHEALSILVKEQPNDDIAVAHDTLYCGEYKPKNYSEIEIQRLDELGFFEGEDSWMSFV